MGYEEFWYQDCALVKAYREADRLRLERRNMEAWLQGLYVYEAVSAIAPVMRGAFNRGRIRAYTEKPHALGGRRKADGTPETKREREDREFTEYMNAWAAEFNAEIARKGGEEYGGGGCEHPGN